MFADRFSMYFDKYWIAPKNDFNSFSVFGVFSRLKASSLSWTGLIPVWSILCPIHSISCLNSSVFFSLSLYPSSSRIFSVLSSSALCSAFYPVVTIRISSGCLFSRVMSIFAWKFVGKSDNP